jgi:chromosomal replication initiator protein
MASSSGLRTASLTQPRWPSPSARPLAYNPLSLYGSAGLGTTHLLQAVADFVRDKNPHFRIRYVSTETLLNDLVDSIRNRTKRAFRRKYRETPNLLLVDVQFVEGKEGFQEELFHTFNALFETGRQIVLACDRSPDHIATIEDGLRTRFKWSLITDVQPPYLETRLAILRKKAERETTPVPHEVLAFIAEAITANVRSLRAPSSASLRSQRSSRNHYRPRWPGACSPTCSPSTSRAA